MNHFTPPKVKLLKSRLSRVVAIAHSLDIGHSAAPKAIFDPLLQGFNIWCTPDDNPGGDWMRVTEHMIPATFTRPCEFVATVYAEWDDDVENIIAMSLSTDAYTLADHLPRIYINSSRPRGNILPIHNRSDDIVWAKAKTNWLFQQAGIPCPIIIVEEK